MKVLLFDTCNAYLTPGGKTTHAVKLQQEISKLGVDIEFARWWDQSQEDFDIIHFLSAPLYMARYAKSRNKKTFFSMIFDFESNKTAVEQRVKMLKNKIIDVMPGTLSGNAYWKALPYMDKIQFMHEQDREAALRYFPKSLKKEKTLIIPHAYDPLDMNISDHLNISDMKFPNKYLVSCANISERKQSVLLAQYAKKAQVPIVFMGSSNDSDSYCQRFKREIDNKYVFYPGYVSREWKDCIEKNAAGYVLLSKGESGCIAVYEAAAYQLPLLLSNLPWAWGYESPTDISFCDFKNEDVAVEQLRNFYNKASRLNHTPFSIHTWSEVAQMYKNVYENL